MQRISIASIRVRVTKTLVVRTSFPCLVPSIGLDIHRSKTNSGSYPMYSSLLGLAASRVYISICLRELESVMR